MIIIKTISLLLLFRITNQKATLEVDQKCKEEPQLGENILESEVSSYECKSSVLNYISASSFRPIEENTKANQLINLTISGTAVIVIPDGTFGHTPALVRVDLSNNRINLIGVDAFAGLDDLSTLDLNNNLLNVKGLKCSFAPSMLPSLTRLQINSNPLEWIQEHLFSGFLGLHDRILELPSDMPCDCSSSWAWRININATVEIGGTCKKGPLKSKKRTCMFDHKPCKAFLKAASDTCLKKEILKDKIDKVNDDELQSILDEEKQEEVLDDRNFYDFRFYIIIIEILTLIGLIIYIGYLYRKPKEDIAEFMDEIKDINNIADKEFQNNDILDLF